MFRPTQPLLKTLRRRAELTTKQAGKEYYKGNRVGSMGVIDKWGNFHPDYSKIRTYVYPARGLKGFELTPFVSERSPPNMQESAKLWSAPAKPMSGDQYLEAWKAQGGHDSVALPEEEPTPEPKKPEVYEPARSSSRA